MSALTWIEIEDNEPEDPLNTCRKRVDNWSLTSFQQRLVKTGGRLVKHARYYCSCWRRAI